MEAGSKISGGYVLQPRRIDESVIMHAPPIVREIWLYLIRKVNHANFKNIERGQGVFRFEDIQNDLSWTVGYRKMTYSKPQITKALRRLREETMIATTKATAGMLITVLNYNKYQDPENYEGNDERTTKATRRQREGNAFNIQECKNVKNEKNEKNTNPPIAPQDDFSVFWQEYPKKVGKMDALKAWGKLNGTRPAIEIILKSIEAQKQSHGWQKENGQFIPNPATWLNRGQWEDETEVTQSHQPPKSIYKEIII
jgi:hypothetical protein